MNDVVQFYSVDEARRRARKIQSLLTLRDPDLACEGRLTIASRPVGPPPCRAALAQWPAEWRERWGRLANALEDAGLPWQEAEARAFVEVWKQRRAETKAQPLALATADVERN